MKVRTEFDEAYYQRFYGDPRTRATSPWEARRCAAFVCNYLKYLELPVSRVLDIGCGLGLLLKAVQTEFPRAKAIGVEYSAHLCERHGWINGSVVDYQALGQFDLVICHDVIQYLSDADTRLAIDNIASLCRGALYLGVLTQEDWDYKCDRSRTDAEVYLRTTRWYRKALAGQFTNLGGGLFLRRPEPVTLWSLESL